MDIALKKSRNRGSDFAERPLRLVEQNQVPCVSDFLNLNICKIDFLALRRLGTYATMLLWQKIMIIPRFLVMTALWF